MINDDLVKQAIELFKKYPNEIGTNLLQRKLKIGFINADKILEELENKNIITKYDKNVGRKLIQKTL